MKRSYSTAELAKMWEVSESTIKRWADAGLLKCRKTVGGHRKFDLEHVLEFRSQCLLSVEERSASGEPPPTDGEIDALLADPDPVHLCQKYREAALGGQECVTAPVLTRAYLNGIAQVEIYESVIKPAMYEIGEMWRAGRVQVYEEHLATSATLRALSRLQMVIEKKPSSGKTALVGCIEGEFHQLAATMVRYVLEAEGWRVIALGSHTPLFSFADALARFKPDMACISATIMDNLERAARDYDRLHRIASRHRARIVLGGTAFKDEEVRARFSGSLYAATLAELLALAR